MRRLKRFFSAQQPQHSSDAHHQRQNDQQQQQQQHQAHQSYGQWHPQQQQRQRFPTAVAGARQRRWRRGGPAEVEEEGPIHVGASKPQPPPLSSAGAIALCVLQHSHATVADSLFVRLLSRSHSLNEFPSMPMPIHTSHVGSGGGGIAESEEKEGAKRKEKELKSRMPSSSSSLPSASPLWSTLLASSAPAARLLADCADRTSGMHAHMQFDEERVGPHGVPPVDVVVGDGGKGGGGFVPQAVAFALLIVLFCTAAFSVATAVIGGLSVFFCVRPLPRAASSLCPRASASTTVSQSSSTHPHCSPLSPRHHTNGSGKPSDNYDDDAASSPPRQMLRITNYGPSPSSCAAPFSSSRHSRSFSSSVAFAFSTRPPLSASSASELPSPPRLFSSFSSPSSHSDRRRSFGTMGGDPHQTPTTAAAPLPSLTSSLLFRSAARSVRYSALLASRLALLGCFCVALVLFCRDDLFSSSFFSPLFWRGNNASVQTTTMGVGGVGGNSAWRGGESPAACGSSPPFVAAALGAQQQQLLELFVLMAFALFAAIANPHNASSHSSSASASAASTRRSHTSDGKNNGAVGAWAGRPSRRPLPPAISSHTDSHSAQNSQLLRPPLPPPSRMRGSGGSEGAFAGRNSVSSDLGLSLPLAFSSPPNAFPKRGFSSSSLFDRLSSICFLLPLPSPPWCPSSAALSLSSVAVLFLLGGTSTLSPACAWAGQVEGVQSSGGGNNSAAAFAIGASLVGVAPSHLFVLLWAPLAWQALCYYSRSAARAHWGGAFFGL